jgi:hypothetical protein
MELSPENPLSAEPEIDTSHAEEFVSNCVASQTPFPRTSISTPRA